MKRGRKSAFTDNDHAFICEFYPLFGPKLWEIYFKNKGILYSEFKNYVTRNRISIDAKKYLYKTRSKRTVRLDLCQKGNKKTREVTPEEGEYIRQNYGKVPQYVITKHLHCAPALVNKYITENNIAKFKQPSANPLPTREERRLQAGIRTLCATCDNLSPRRCSKVRTGKGEWSEGVLARYTNGEWMVLVTDCPSYVSFAARRSAIKCL